jgi:hypothetical protein
MAYPMGDADKGALRVDFDRRLLLQFCGSTITSDAGLLAYLELDDTLRLTDTCTVAQAGQRGDTGFETAGKLADVGLCLSK